MRILLTGFPSVQMTASNNYSVAFDLKLTGTTEVYVHFVGLDGTNNSNIYLRIVGQGAYLCITDNFGHDIYNNTGDLHGGLDATPVALEDFAHFELVHFEGYLELWVNGTRRCVSHLCDFGNNNYMSRSPIEEGTITAIALHAQNANAAVVDNIKVTEPTGAATSYSETNADITTSSSKTFPLSALNLYRENFLAEASFVITDETASGYYPTIKLFGLNASLRSNNQKEYAVNVQALVNGTSFQPQIMWQPEDPETAWDGVTGTEVTVAQGQTVTMRVEVYGDHFDLYVNGEISVSTTFTEMGLEEGRVQYIRVQSGNGGAAQTSDLVIYASDDDIAMSWTRPGNVVEAGYSRNLPECPSLMKIGDRWYVFVSVAYNTAHQVGPLQYWTGDAGVDCMDVDWSDKDFAFLDGEDLCAARPTQVGGKVYMWGWIPSTYDTMPWAPWAGYLNLPREVVQREDGSLGGRLDPGLSALLNYGNVYSLGADNFAVESGAASASEGTLSMSGSENYVRLGDFHRSYVTFRADMGASDCVGYVMRQDGREYRVVIERENSQLYMKVLSPDDPSHKVNSVIALPDDTDVFDVKIVNDGEFVEFFVNDTCALTAHTAMTGTTHTAYLYSDSAATFSDVNIAKLRPYGEI